MTLAAIIAIIPGFFKFFDEVSILIKQLEKTPEQKHDALMAQVQGVFNEKDNGGRPKWG